VRARHPHLRELHRNTLDISAIPVIKKLSHLPIITDPSHATGMRNKVAPMARASVAAGRRRHHRRVHCNPDKALSDGAQSMFPAQFDRVMAELRHHRAGDRAQHLRPEPVVKRGWGR
jgi:3-deoxy-D-arabino-heptulosonate 7-phosphate (DAHP) synthase